MVQEHDFKRFPELTNNQISLFLLESPHEQILDDINVRVIKVTDGDTVRVRWSERNFDFPVRIANLAAPELKEVGGRKSQKWLEREILNTNVDLILTRARVEKWGRLLAYILIGGFSITDLSIHNGFGISWRERKNTGQIGNLLEELDDGT